MKVTVLASITAILALLAAGLWWQQQNRFRPASEHPLVGQPVLPADIAQGANTITISGDDGQTLKLEKHNQGHWILPDYFSLPVDFSRLANTMQEFADAKVKRAVTSNNERLEAMNLGSSSLEINSTGSNWRIQIGESPERGGTFFKYADEPMAFLSSETLRINTSPENWVRKQVLPFSENDVAVVEIPLPGTNEHLRFKRNDAESDFSPDNPAAELAEGETVQQAELKRIIRSFSSARFTEPETVDDPDVVDARSHEQTVNLELLNGQRYTLHIGRRPEITRSKENPDDNIKTETQGPMEGLAEADSETASQTVAQNTTANTTEEQSAGTDDADDTRQTDDDETNEIQKKPETETIPAGPVFIRVTSTATDFPYPALETQVALKYANYLYDLLPKARAQIIEPAPEAESSKTGTETNTEAQTELKTETASDRNEADTN